MSDGLSQSERQQLAAVSEAKISCRLQAAHDGGLRSAHPDDMRNRAAALRLVREALKSYRAGQDINAWYKSGGSAAAALGRS